MELRMKPSSKCALAAAFGCFGGNEKIIRR